MASGDFDIGTSIESKLQYLADEGCRFSIRQMSSPLTPAAWCCSIGTAEVYTDDFRNGIQWIVQQWQVQRASVLERFKG